MFELAAFALILAIATFLVRIVQPIGTSVMNFQLCFFPQYILAFIFGITAARQGWLEELAVAQKTRTLGLLGVLLGPVLLLIVLKLGGPFPEQGANPYAGGLHP